MRSTSMRPIVPAPTGPGATWVFLAFTLLIGGCGEPARPVPAGTTGSAPSWRIKPVAAGRTGAILRVSAPCRTRIRVERTGRDSRPTPWRDLVAGETVEILWSYRPVPGARLEEEAPPADAALGRTKGHAVWISAYYDDGATNEHRQILWTRPATGRLQHVVALPPGRFEALPPDGSVELLTVVAGDFVAGRTKVKRRGLETRVTPPAAAADGDRVETLRVFLDISPAP